MDSRIGVLFIQAQSAFGADSAVHADLMRHLDRDAFSVHVGCTVGEGDEKPESMSVLESVPDLMLRPTRFVPGFRFRTRDELLGGVRAGLRFPSDFIDLARYVRRHGIRVLHSSDRPRDAAYCVALGWLTGAKSVVHVHVKWSSEYSLPARLSVHHADAAFGISRYVSDTIVGMGKPAHRVHTVLNGIDLARWDPTIDGTPIRREFAIPDRAPLLVSVSRLFSWKGQRELVRALPLVQKEVPDVFLLIVGADAGHVQGKSFTEELRELARELGIADRVIFAGKRSDVPQVMAACDLFTLPSFEEPFGLVFLEAMAMQKPVIALNNGGTPEVVEHGRTGLLSPPWDVPALASNIVALLRDRERARRMGEAGRARVLESFTAQRMARDAANAYREVLAQ